MERMASERVAGAFVAMALASMAMATCNGVAPDQASPAGEFYDAVPRAVEDETITASVKEALVQESGAEALQIGVETREGTVKLSGRVDSPAERELAETTARGVSGVRSVVNRLEVVSS
jgi:hyperosmotically inducible protein